MEARKIERLHERRFFNFQKSALKGSLKLENLPPTEGATTQHAYRSYLQLQQWPGYNKDPVAENMGYDVLKCARHVMVIVARTSKKP